jgi:uncharacterized protein YbjT (DUF2867 family)
MDGKTAIIAGATGLVGKELLQLLLQGKEYEKVIALVRRPLGVSDPKLKEVITDFSCLQDYEQYFSADDVFVCLGTTIKKAKTQEAMYQVDVEFPMAIGELAKKKGAKHYLIISSMNANSKSPIFYSRMKGELEEKIKSLSFEKLSIFRPSLLLGKRQEFRLGEELGALFSKGLRFLFFGPLRKYKSIEGKTVAKAMYNVAQENQTGTWIYSSDEIETIGSR